MSEQAVKTIFRKDYKPVGFVLNSVDLTFELHDEFAIVINKMHLKNLGHVQPLELYGDELELLEIKLNDEPLSEKNYVLSDDSLILDKSPDEFYLETKTKIYPQKNMQLSGLYRSNGMFCTQCEAEGFRRITYFLDRPDVLSKYTTKIIADKQKYPVLLSNGNPVDSGELDGGKHWVTWQDPFKKPSYLFALVAGDLVHIEDKFITQSKREITLKIFVEKGNEKLCDHAMISLKKSMKWDEEVYGREYDLDIFMIVAVSDFNMGAMENKGLNIFNTKYVLADKESATDADFEGIEGVVAHEYFHNWTGNRVTCRDWFQLSLKEGLTVFRDQEFSRDMNSRSVNRIKDVKILRSHQFPEDAGPMAHPVRPESFIEINNFYTTTIYNKGAEVIRMQHSLLGANKFRKGMDLYFERHDGQAVTIDDFVAAMEDANNVDLSQFKRWYSQAGTPQIKAKAVIDSGTLTLTLSQFCKATPGQDEKLPFYIPIKLAIFSPAGQPYDIQQELIILNEEKHTYEFHDIEDGAVVSLLRDFSAPVSLSFNQKDDDLRLLIEFETDGFARFEAMYKLQKRVLHELLKQAERGEQLQFNSDMAELYSKLLQQSDMDMALKAELLQPLSFEEIVSELKQIDVAQVMSVRDFYLDNLAEHCREEMLSHYLSLTASAADSGARKLKNVLLSYLSRDSKNIKLLKQQFEQANNMTDEIAALSLIVNQGAEVADDAITAFYNKWSSQELVLDKWFTVQASADTPEVIQAVTSLMVHSDFHLSNPNKVRALISGFAMGNPRYFHTEAGYQILADVICKLDKVNPQTAARLVTPLTRWQRYHPTLQSLMKTALTQILSVENLSKDVFEVVSKSLDVSESAA